MAFSFGSTQPTSSGFGSNFTFGGGQQATATATGFSFGAPAASTSTAGFGSTFGAPAAGPSGFNLSFGAPATTTSTAPTTGFGGFGGAATSTGGSLFGGGGLGTTTTSTAPTLGAFGGFGAAGGAPTAAGAAVGIGGVPLAATTTTAPSLFSGFGSGGFGTASGAVASTTTSAAAPTLFSGGFGSTATTQPTFSGFGTAFGAKPATTFSFGGTPLGTTSTLGQSLQQQQQQQQQQALPDPNQAIYNSIFNCHVFGDERDAILAKWNLLQASWGVGKGYYSQSQPPVEYKQQNPYCRFKAIGYSVIPGHENRDGLVALIIAKKEAEIKAQKEQIVNCLTQVLGNKPQLSVCVDLVKALGEQRSEVLVGVQERSAATGGCRKIPATELAAYLVQAAPRQQLAALGVENLFAHVRPDAEQLKEYLATPPLGIDARLWKQAQSDNPDAAKYIPVPLLGFDDLKWRIRCQEYETGLHNAFLERVSADVVELRRKHASSVAMIAEQKRRFRDLQHRVLQLLVRQEVTRKAGMALQPEEEALKAQLEGMQAQIGLPTQFKGRLNELLAQIRMQQKAGDEASERYIMEPAVQEDVKQFLRMEQKGIAHLVEMVNQDMADLKTVKEGLAEIMARQH